MRGSRTDLYRWGVRLSVAAMLHLAVTLLLRFVLAADEPVAPVERIAAEVVAQLDRELPRLTEDPEEYARLVRTECQRFPEGDLFPYTLPVLAWAGLAEGDRKAADLARMERLLELAEATLVKRLARLVPQVASAHAAIMQRARSGEAAMPGLPAKLRSDRYTGFLYGDIVLFHALTWGRTARLFRP